MAKKPTEYYEVNEFKIIERGFNIDRNKVSESIFSLGNEYMGVRGYAEEGITKNTLQGSYFNGIYEYARETPSIHYKGIIERTHFMINSVNWLKCNITVNGQKLDCAVCNISEFVRELDMRSGLLTRSFIWTLNSGEKVRLKFSRFLSMTDCRRAYSALDIESIDFEGEAVITQSLDFKVLHWGKACYWKEGVTAKNNNATAVMCNTFTTNQRIAAAMTIDSEEEGADFSDAYETGKVYRIKLDKKTKKSFVRSVYCIAETCISDKDILKESLINVDKDKTAFVTALEKNIEYYNKVWENSDIEIKGDAKNQQGIRFCIFQLQQTYHGLDPHNNIGAKGLTGEAYSGHAFWDTETYCLPFYLFNNMPAAKNLLTYRYLTLPQARARAKELDCKGACYPIATLNGQEACNLWQHASLQFQPSTAVVYGIRHYVSLSGDRQFLFDYGLEMLIEISRLLVSRGDFNAKHTKFGYYSVMGPDEFQMMVNHNCYTNFMAKKTLDYTLTEIDNMSRENKPAMTALLKRLNITKEELAGFSECASNMYLPYDEETKLYEQHEGFFDLPHIDIHKIPVEEFPLYYHWSYDRIYRNDMIKQPDVLMFMFLYNTCFDKETKRANYEYYEPRCIHESSLSPSIHSVFAAELGKMSEASDFFGFATRMDLDDYNRNTDEGLHTTSIAAAWVNIVYGFGGLRSDGEKLILNPVLPEKWEEYSFRFIYKNTSVKVTVNKSGVTVNKISGEGFDFVLYNKEVTLKNTLTAEIQ